MNPTETMTNQIDRLDLASLDVAEERIAKLREDFPEVFREGQIDFESLRRALGDWVDPGKERFGLTWPGKADCMRIIQQPSVGTLVPDRAESVDFDTTQNLIIEGDNLEVLKLLQKSYYGKVKMIYIDPPYNTGNDFIYPDNFREGLLGYLRYSGQVDDEGMKLSTNTESEGRFHSKWLNMMHPRLFLARNLLRDDGVIFVSIDDHEVHDLGMLMNEIFGEENFVATMIWKKMDSPSRNEENRAVTDFHEYILVYGRNKAKAGLRPMPKEGILSGYTVPLPDGRLARRRQLRKNGKSARREDRPTLWYPLTAPDGTLVFPIAPEGWEGRWVLSEETWVEREQAGLTDWIKRDYGWVPYYLEIAPAEPTVPWSTLLTDVDQNRQATAEFTELMGSTVDFDNPKPVSLMRRLLQMATAEEDICLDFFAGSGSTAQAAMELNKEDGGNRRFILVQLPEPTERNDCPTIADICRERVRRAVKAIANQRAGKLDLDGHGDPDLGFRAYKLTTSNFKPWDGDPDKIESVAQQIEFFADNVLPDRTSEDILSEILLKTGFELTTPVERLTLAGKEVFSVAEGALLVCLDRALTIEVIEAMVVRDPAQIICLDAGFNGNDQLKVNALQLVKARARDHEASMTFKVV